MSDKQYINWEKKSVMCFIKYLWFTISKDAANYISVPVHFTVVTESSAILKYESCKYKYKYNIFCD